MSTTRKRYETERRILQIVIGTTVVFPLVLGGLVALTGAPGLYLAFGLQGPPPGDPTLDSGIRFLASNFFGMGLLVLWVLPKVERRVVPFRIFVATALVGATMRIVSHVTVGPPNAMTQALIGVEFSVLALGLWQTRVHRMWRALAGDDETAEVG